MVGNPSVPAVALAVALALHATILTPHNVAAEDASAAVENINMNNTNDRRLRRRLRRRPTDSSGQHAQHVDVEGMTQRGFEEYHFNQRQFVESMESTAAKQSQHSISELEDGYDRTDRGGHHRTLQSCQWFPDPQNQDGCTDDPDRLLPEWKNNPLMVHATAKSCCDLFFKGRTCEQYPSGKCGGGAGAGDAGGGGGCTSIGWHADMKNQDGCTDDDHYPPEWVNMPLRTHMFHATADACCAATFPGRPCKQYPSGCALDGGGDVPMEDCTSPGWYADTTSRDGCTNGVDYDKEWLPEPKRSDVFFATHQECCDRWFKGKTCKKHDRGCDIDPNLNRCESEWHPDSHTRSGCTNDGAVPSSWRDPSQKATYFFGSAYACCTRYHKGGKCVVRDACDAYAASEIQITDSPTQGPTYSPNECKWHPSQDSGTACEYSDGYPYVWRNSQWSSQYLFDSHGECCKGAHGLESCGKKLTCATPAPTERPTTKTPTLSPVIAPTGSPTAIFFLVWNSYECVSAAYSIRPFYITDEMTYTDYDQCCENSPQKDDCLAMGPTPAPTDFTPTVSPRPTTLEPTIQTLYFVEHFEGSCIAGTRATIPHYSLDKAYANYWTCCQHSHAKEKCMAEGPTQEPTSMPSDIKSDVPSAQPFSMPSTEPSSQPSKPTGPTTPPTTFYWGAYMSFTSKPTQRPTKVDCSDLFWHVDPDASDFVCTNIEADLETKDATMLFQSAEACCAHFFQGMDCTLRSMCSHGTNVIPASDNLPAPEDVCDNSWHPDIGPGRSGCSNSLNIPPTWKDSTVQLLFETVDDCCQELYLDRGNHCKVYNYCVTEAPTNHPTTRRPTPQPVTPQPVDSVLEAPSVCDSAKWHIVTGSHQLACSNSLRYPESWDDPVMSKKFLFDSPDECCERFTMGTSQPCGRHYDCTEPAEDPVSSCEAARWHMTTDFSKCSNNHVYNDSWLDEESKYFFDSSTQCCVSIFGYADCQVEDICTTETPGPSRRPTPRPSGNPTHAPTTRNPTPLPTTKKPTPAPMQQADALSDGANPNSCDGKTRKQCNQNPRCAYNRPERTCIQNASKTQPAPNPPSKPAKTTESATCEGKRTRKQCRRTPSCIWNDVLGSCAGPDISPAKTQEKPSDTTTISQTSCEGRKWHPRTVNDRTCSNSLDYPKLWNVDEYSGQFLFNTYRGCCRKFYGGNCDKEDVCLRG